jgi:hypothetical protein
MNTKSYWLGGCALLLIGCNSGDSGFNPLYALAPKATLDTSTNPPTVTCEDVSPSDPAVLGLSVNVNTQSALTLLVVAENNDANAIVELQRADPQEQYVVSAQIQPVRFDFRWECDTTGFTANLGPLYVPAFSVNEPFCLDSRDEASRTFVGFDIVPASGAAIEGESRGIIETRVVPPQLMEGISDTFKIAKEADACCDQVGGCDNLDMADPTDTTRACGRLQNLFDAVAGQGAFNVKTLADVQRWRPFVAYTSLNGTGKVPVPYTMRLRGRFEGLTPTGDLITSTDFTQEIGFCEGCFTNAGNACLNY